MASVTVQDQFNAQVPTFSLVLHWREGVPMRLSSLIRERVMLEWERREDQGRPLVGVKAGAPGKRPSMTCEEAVTIALQGFRQNAYFVIVDDAQITDLDAEISITPSTAVTFVRLLPLVGG